MIEKAYAKIHTLRFSSSAISEDDMGGWEAIGGGGKVEDALADLTGGVAGRFNTKVPAQTVVENWVPGCAMVWRTFRSSQGCTVLDGFFW